MPKGRWNCCNRKGFNGRGRALDVRNISVYQCVTFETHVPGADELTVQAMESWFEETEIISTLATFFFHCLWWVFWVCREVWCQPPKKICIFPCLQDSQHILTTLRSFRSIVFFCPFNWQVYSKGAMGFSDSLIGECKFDLEVGRFCLVIHQTEIPNDLFEMDNFVVTYRNFHKNSTMWRYDSNLYMKFHHRSHERIICLWGFQKKRCDRVAVLVGKLAIKRFGWYGYRDIPFGPFGFLWIQKSLVTGRRQDRCLAMKWKEFLAQSSWHKERGPPKKKRNRSEIKWNTHPKTKMTMENPPGWRCTLYWTPGSSNVMLVFRGGPQWSRMTGGFEILVDQQNVWTTWLPL